MNTEWLALEYFGNTAADYLRFIVIVGSGAILLLVSELILGRWIRRIDEKNEKLKDRLQSSPGGAEADAAAIVRLKSTTIPMFFKKIVLPLLFLGITAAALSRLTFQERMNTVVQGAFAAVITIVVIRTINKSLEISFTRYFANEAHAEQARYIKPLLVLIKFLLWIFGIIFLLANLGYDVTTAVAGLGVSGIAVAIAAQGILGDLFNYFVILFDKPFELGDFILFDDKLGVVEKIGIKTARIRTLQGEILVVANSDLAAARIHNFKKMMRRRVVQQIGVVYQTSQEHVLSIPTIIREIIESVESVSGVICDRSHFKGFGPYSLEFETIYYIPGPDYTLFMNVQQEINQRLLEAFRQRGIVFAYPSQTLFIEKENGRS